jgi:hypothetical protein
MKVSALLLAFAANAVVAQRPNGTSICDYYTTALLKVNNATNQYTLLTLVVNTAVIGNYTQPNVGIAVPGILAKGMYNGTAVNLLPYFDGSLASANTGGSSGAPQNFLDDGGKMRPVFISRANNHRGCSPDEEHAIERKHGIQPIVGLPPPSPLPPNTTSILLTHLYEYFGVLLGCTMVGQTGYPKYSGSNSMGDVHRFMDLNPAQLGYFITQVGLSAASFGVATADITAVGTALAGLFGQRCSAAAVVVPDTPAAPQAICQDAACPQATANANCSAYGKAVAPASATASSAGATGTAGAAPSASGGSKPSEGVVAQAVSALGTLLAAVGFAFML